MKSNIDNIKKKKQETETIKFIYQDVYQQELQL
jgi:hypothetical protein